VSTRSRIEKQERQQANIVFNEVWQFAYVLGAKERDLLIQQSIISYSLLSKNFQETFSEGIQSMWALILIYSQRVPGI